MTQQTETPRSTTDPLDPFDPRCGRFASDMTELDDFIIDAPNQQVTPEDRRDFVRTEEGTYNHRNGHFLCDECYIAIGMPSSPNGWSCP